MDLSIVIVSWNTRAILRACLRSVIDRAGDLPLEVFVVDNASEDGSAEMVREEFPKARLIQNANNLGFAAANNQAIRLATGRYVLLLNSDTVILGDVLAESVRYMDAHGDVGVLGCRVLNPDRSMQPTCFQYPSLFNLALLTSGLSGLPWPRFLGRQRMSHWQRDDERDVDVVTGCYMLARKSAMDQVGLLDESFFFCGEETDWCRRFKRAGWRICFAPVGEIIHIGNASGQKRKHQRDVLLTEGLVRYHRKYGGIIAALLAWMILWVFNVTHYIGWWGLSVVSRQRDYRGRKEHFRAVVKDMRNAWPSPRHVIP